MKQHHEAGHGADRLTPTVVFHIAVNGQVKVWHHKKISYEEVVELAFPAGPTGGNIKYTVTWTKPNGHEGGLKPGFSENVDEDMVFDVRNTDKS